jgi:hypothetical protein
MSDSLTSYGALCMRYSRITGLDSNEGRVHTASCWKVNDTRYESLADSKLPVPCYRTLACAFDLTCCKLFPIFEKAGARLTLHVVSQIAMFALSITLAGVMRFVLALSARPCRSGSLSEPLCGAFAVWANGLPCRPCRLC